MLHTHVGGVSAKNQVPPSSILNIFFSVLAGLYVYERISVNKYGSLCSIMLEMSVLKNFFFAINAFIAIK